MQSNVGTFCGTQLPNTFVALCNTYIIPLAPKTKESVFSKRAGLFFVAIDSLVLEILLSPQRRGRKIEGGCKVEGAKQTGGAKLIPQRRGGVQR